MWHALVNARPITTAGDMATSAEMVGGEALEDGAMEEEIRRASLSAVSCLEPSSLAGS